MLDSKWFVLTGSDGAGDRRKLETSRRGVFAIGDVRSGSVKRVAAAVGEGAQVVAALHAFLAADDRNPTAIATA
jgi:thioredoxin reductase (NADPH)